MPSQRVQRVSRQILQELSEILSQSSKDPRLNGVTITDVDMSPDLKNARVYYSILGVTEDRESSQAALEHAEGFMKRQIGRRLNLKYIPELKFEFDDSLERADRIARLIDSTSTDFEAE